MALPQGFAFVYSNDQLALTITARPEHQKAASGVLVVAVQSGALDYWSLLESVEEDGEHAPGFVGDCTAINLLDTDTSRRHRVTEGQIVRAAVGVLVGRRVDNNRVRRVCSDLIFWPQHADVDGTVADVLVQYAIFGKLIYG